MRIHLQMLIWLALSTAALFQAGANNCVAGPVWPVDPSAVTPASVGSTSASPVVTSASPASTDTSGGSTNSHAATVLNTASYLMDDKHILQPGDKLSFQIIEDKDPPRELVVADSRELDVPYIGRVSVANKTCKQLAKELKAPLEKEYYYRATVIIGVETVNHVRGKVYVSGQVHNQGPIDLFFDENLTVQKAILRAGGFADFANKRRVKVIRNSGDAAKKQIFEVNMQEVLDGKTEKDIVLEPDDLIEVPSRAVNF